MKNKKDGLFLIKRLMPKFSIVLFDYRLQDKNGLSFTTLGLRESQDLKLIISFLLDQLKGVHIYLWGRGLGAVSILNLLFTLEV